MRRVGNYRAKLTLADHREIARRYREGEPAVKLAELYDVSRQTIWRTLHRAGVNGNGRWPAGSGGNGEVIRDKEDGGCIVTIRNAAGERRSLYEHGRRKEALLAVTERVDRMPGEWRIISYSTSATIVTDLKTRNTLRTDDSLTAGQSVKSASTQRKPLPEYNTLGRLGRLDLLAPELGGPE